MWPCSASLAHGPCFSSQPQGWQPLGSTYRPVSALGLWFLLFTSRDKGSETQLEVNTCGWGSTQHGLGPIFLIWRLLCSWDSFYFDHILVLNGALIISCVFPCSWPALDLDSGSWPSVTWILLSMASFLNTVCSPLLPACTPLVYLLVGSHFVTSGCPCMLGSHQEAGVL